MVAVGLGLIAVGRLLIALRRGLIGVGKRLIEIGVCLLEIPCALVRRARGLRLLCVGRRDSTGGLTALWHRDDLPAPLAQPASGATHPALE